MENLVQLVIAVPLTTSWCDSFGDLFLPAGPLAAATVPVYRLVFAAPMSLLVGSYLLVSALLVAFFME